MARPPKAESKHSGPINMSLFSDKELEDLETQAREEFELESKTQAADAFKEEQKRKLREKSMFAAGKDAEGDEIEPITINLAPHSPFISINGAQFYHGVTYKFTKNQAATIKDIMFRTWQHEREIGGANMNAEFGRTPFNKVIAA